MGNKTFVYIYVKRLIYVYVIGIHVMMVWVIRHLCDYVKFSIHVCHRGRFQCGVGNKMSINISKG